jgi:uncharacterized protein YhjY with autotransporter beta-barrel domain
MRRTAAITVVSYFALCHFAHAQTADVRTLTTWTKSSLNDMGLATSFYSGVLSYRGPQLVNVWGVGNLDWPPLSDPYTGGPPGGVTVGADFVDQRGWTIGFAASSTSSRPALSNGGSASVTGLGGTIYASYDRGVGIGDFRAIFQSTFDSVDIDLHRNELMKGLLFGNRANVNGWAWTPSATLSYVLTERWFQHGPLVSIGASNTYLNAFSETGSLTSHSISEQTTVGTTASAGYSAKFEFLNFQPFALIKADYSLSSTPNTVQSAFISGIGPTTSFQSSGTPPLWSFNTQLGSRIFLTPSVTAFAAWAVDYNEHFGPTENQALVGMSYAF